MRVVRFCKRVVAAGMIAALGATCAMAQSPQSREPIKVAVFDALGGQYASYGLPAVYSAQHVFGKVNESGGLFGRKIELIQEDNGCAPKQAVGGATKLLANNKIVAVLGLTCSGAAIAVRDAVADQTDVPFISYSGGGLASSSPALGGLKSNFFFISPPMAIQAGAIVNFVMAELKPKRVAFIGQSDVVGKEGLEGVEQMLKSHGVSLVAIETVEARTTDLTPQILKLQQARPDVVLTFMYDVPVQTFLRQSTELNFDTKVVTNGSLVNFEIFKSIPEQTLKRHYGVTVLKDTMDSSVLKPTVDAMRALAPNAQINWLSLLGVAGAEVLLQAMKNAGPDLDAKKVKAELGKLAGANTSTLAYPITFTPENHSGGRGVAVYQMVKGKQVFLSKGYWSGTEKAAKPTVP